MGYIRNETIVVSSRSVDRLIKAHAMACHVFDNHGIGSLVSGVVQHRSNGGAAFFVSPDGSKEGWAESAAGDKARDELKKELRANPDLYLDWAHIILGGDNGKFEVKDSPAEDKAEAA